MTTLENRVAVVTGASSGIGTAAAKLLAARGAKVALLARRGEQIDQVAQEIKEAGGEALAIVTDVTDASAVASAADRVRATFGDVDLVVNNAGVMLPAPMTERRTDYWQREIDVNIKGALAVIDTFLPDLVAAAERGGRADLINLSSIAAQYVFPNLAVYDATKAAISHLSRTMRAELGPQGVRVSAVEPGLVSTELQGHSTDESINDWIASARQEIDWLDPDDIAETVAFVAAQPKHVNLAQITVFPTRQG